jgi:hypothetical protein
MESKVKNISFAPQNIRIGRENSKNMKRGNNEKLDEYRKNPETFC